MQLSSFVGLILGTWSIFHLIHNFLMGTKYFGQRLERFCERHCIHVTIFQINYFTNRFNRFLLQISSTWNLQKWFNAGVVFCCVFMLPSIFLLLHTLYGTLHDLLSTKPTSQDTQVLSVMLPGVTFPVGDFGFMLFAILVSGIFHELGHAVAAVGEGAHVSGFGVFLLLIYPGAYVKVERVEELGRSRSKLRIYCAGVWHNFALSVCVCLLVLALPALIAPAYSRHDDRVVVTDQTRDSPLDDGERGLMTGDIINSIAGCHVTDTHEWFRCINSTAHRPPSGSCLSTREMVKHAHESTQEESCCPVDAPHTHICYRFHPQPSALTEYACLPGRLVTSYPDCHSNEDCAKSSSADVTRCVIPHPGGGQRLTRIEVRRGEKTYHVLYLGLPHDLFYYVTISQYSPRFALLPHTLPAFLLKLLQYMFSISSALGILNIIPCYALDGQHIFKSMVEQWCGGTSNERTRIIISDAAACVGTGLVAANVVAAFARALT